MSELHSLVPVFNVGSPILSVLFSLAYDEYHFHTELLALHDSYKQPLSALEETSSHTITQHIL